MKKIIIIGGPTGVGKSDFAELLAQQIDGEIINADQGQLYEPLSIGTAKPDWKNKSIKHHLFDLISTPRNYSNAEYQKSVKACIDDVHARGKRAILVGGSGFYYQMLFFEFLPLPEKPSQESAQVAYPRTWQELQRIDPVRAAAVHPHDQYRIERALELYYTYTILPSRHGLVYKPYTPYLFVHIHRDIEDLYQRIDMRTGLMIKDGWLEEVKHLQPEWQEFIRVKKIIGYDDILAYRQNKIDYQVLIATIQQKTRNYAKRQRTYFRTLLKKIPISDHAHIQEINLTLSPIDLYLNQLVLSIESK